VNKKMQNNNLQKGVSIYLIVIIISTLLAVSLNVATLIVGGAKIISNSADSVKAFYAANTGVEEALYLAKSSNSCDDFNSDVGGINNYHYVVTILCDCDTGCVACAPGQCLETGTAINSEGQYRSDGINVSTRRKISIGY
jgi:hypothetical protein